MHNGLENRWLLLMAGLCLLGGCQQQESLVVTVAGADSNTVSIVEDATASEETADTSAVHVANIAESTENDLEVIAEKAERFVPTWVAEAVFYQVFPDRFRNGDQSNDPTRESLEDAETVPKNWRITPWTSDWYEQADWERTLSENFYEKGVFNRRYGGDLQGVLDKLDYLEGLGINAIYFNPVFYARSLHKYDASAMHHVDPHFGPDPVGDLKLIALETNDTKTWQWTAADKLFLTVLSEIHERGMHAIIDGVFNHTGRDFFAFADLREKQAASPYKDWYIVQYFDNPATPFNDFRYKSWWGFETLPEFADTKEQDDLHPGPKQYIFDITRRWMDPNGDGDPSDGVDGWRLDVANEVPIGFWSDWNELVRELNPQAYTVGEFWDNAREHLIEGRFSGTMNYHGFAYLVKGFLIDGTLTPHDFGQELVARLAEYPRVMQFAMQNLIDSHDTERVGSMVVNAVGKPYLQPDRFDYDVSERVSPRYAQDYNVRKPSDRELQLQRLVVLMQMTFIGPPMVYYGSESGMWGADDPCNRLPMVWDDLVYDPQTADPLNRPRGPDEVTFNANLHNFYTRMVRLRRENPVLAHGTFSPLVGDDDAKFFAFRRQWQGKQIIVAINRGDATFALELPSNNGHELSLIAAASDATAGIEISKRDGMHVVKVPPLEAVILAEATQAEETQSP
jgi:cyclomaltodextrinase / maltogenic alpha-amylase / neopullulanase